MLRKYFFVVFLLFFCVVAYANKENELKELFQNKAGCFILYDVQKEKVLEKFNPKHCQLRVSPNSTFKIPLSVIAYDKKIISSSSTFQWDGKNREIPQWNHNQTPHSWLQYSVVWISQQLTPQLGFATITNKLKKFHYGNHDFTGHPGKNDGFKLCMVE